jgi:hypothetical protein
VDCEIVFDVPASGIARMRQKGALLIVENFGESDTQSPSDAGVVALRPL